MTSTPTERDWEQLRAGERRLLDISGLAVRQHDLTINGEGFHVLEAGDPHLPPLVMIHGRGGAAALFSTVFAALARHRHLYAIDMRGWGLSSRAPFTGTTPDAAVEWWRDGVLATIDALGLTRYDLLGHSLGGMIAITVTLARAVQIDHLILEDNGGFPGKVPFGVRLYFNISPERLARSASKGLVQRVGRSALVFPEQSPAFVQAARDFTYTLTTFPGTDVSGVRAFNKILDVRGSHFTLAKRLGELRPLTRLIWGERDGVIPLAIPKASVKLIPRGDLAIIPGIGHSPHMEAPTAFVRLVLQGLARGDEVPLSS